jgi:hypothetical protein
MLLTLGRRIPCVHRRTVSSCRRARGPAHELFSCFISSHHHPPRRITIDQVTIKTPNPKCRLYWYLIEFIDLSGPAHELFSCYTSSYHHPPRRITTSLPIDQITVKSPNPNCRLYWCLIEFIDWRFRSQSCW